MGEHAGLIGAADLRYILRTDIGGSSRLCERYPQAFAQALAQHNSVTEEAIAACHGEIYRTTGDGYVAFFADARDCLGCLVRLQREFAAFPPLGADEAFLVRAIAHGGAIRVVGGDCYGAALNRAARICQVGQPGQSLISAVVARQLAGQLDDGIELLDLGEHHLRDLGEPEHLYQIDHPAFARHSFPALPTLDNRPTNLAVQPNTFVGRSRELAELSAMLHDGQRLVTITAPGGYGKSRLAVHLCSDLLEGFARGVYVVLLAPVREYTGVTAAIAGAVGFQFHGSREPQQQVIDYLREKQLLLCLDNFEHVMEAAPFISEILGQAPQVRMVITSREPLRIAGEQVYPLEPLPVGERADQLEQAEAVQLLVDRATLVNPGLRFDADNLALLREICRRLSGIPLAIELAAAWMDSFTPAELRDELDQQLELTARLADTPARHRSLRASLDWSWNLLSEDQRRTLMQMATFRGGCFADSAAAVIGLKGMSLREALARLIDKSWLFARPLAGKTRYFMRDAASREYAFGKLEQTRAAVDGDSLYESAVLAHAQLFSQLMEQEGGRLWGTDQLTAIRELALEIENVYEALDSLLNRVRRSLEVSSPAARKALDLLLPICRELTRYLSFASNYHEMLARYQLITEVVSPAQTLETPTASRETAAWGYSGLAFALQGLGRLAEAGSAATRSAELVASLGNPARLQGHVLALQGHLAFCVGDLAQSLAYYRASLSTAEQAGLDYLIVESLTGLGKAEIRLGNDPTARELLEQACALSDRLGDRMARSRALNCLAELAYRQRNRDEARRLCQEILDFLREAGHTEGEALLLNNLGLIEQAAGDHAAARRLYDQALSLLREVGSRQGIATCLANIAELERHEGNLSAAREACQKSLAIRRELKDQHGVAQTLNSLGQVEHDMGELAGARCHWTEAISIASEIGARPRFAQSSHNLGVLEVELGNCLDAIPHLRNAIVVSGELGSPPALIGDVLAIGCLLARMGQLVVAAKLLLGGKHAAAALDIKYGSDEEKLLALGMALLGPAAPAADGEDVGAAGTSTGQALARSELAQLEAEASAISVEELTRLALAALSNLGTETLR